jgi:hypothetical protein
MQITLAFILAVASHIHDSHGYQKPIPIPVAEAIVLVSNEAPLWVEQERETGATLTYWSFQESSWLTNVEGDGHRSCGLIQTPCKETPRDAVGQLRVALKWMRHSMATNPEHPFAVYASGDIRSIQGMRISDMRSRAVHELLALTEAD